MMVLSWAVWICGLLIWIVLLVITLQLPTNSSVSCEMEKARSCGYLPPDSPGAFRALGRSDPKTESKGSFPAEKNPPEKTRELHFLNSIWFCGWCWHNWRTAGRGWTSNTQKNVLFHLPPLLHFQCRRMLSQTPASLVCLFVLLLEEKDFFGLWGAVQTPSQNAVQVSLLLTGEHCPFSVMMPGRESPGPQPASPERQGTSYIPYLLPGPFTAHHWLCLLVDFGVCDAVDGTPMHWSRALTQMRDSSPANILAAA